MDTVLIELLKPLFSGILVIIATIVGALYQRSTNKNKVFYENRLKAYTDLATIMDQLVDFMWHMTYDESLDYDTKEDANVRYMDSELIDKKFIMKLYTLLNRAIMLSDKKLKNSLTGLKYSLNSSLEYGIRGKELTYERWLSYEKRRIENEYKYFGGVPYIKDDEIRMKTVSENERFLRDQESIAIIDRCVAQKKYIFEALGILFHQSECVGLAWEDVQTKIWNSF